MAGFGVSRRLAHLVRLVQLAHSSFVRNFLFWSNAGIDCGLLSGPRFVCLFPVLMANGECMKTSCEPLLRHEERLVCKGWAKATLPVRGRLVHFCVRKLSQCLRGFCKNKPTDAELW